jgi:hypothetical protein
LDDLKLRMAIDKANRNASLGMTNLILRLIQPSAMRRSGWQALVGAINMTASG